jgi:hypothetical protein
MMVRIALQSLVCSPWRRQIDSNVNLTPGGGLFIDFTSTKSFFLIPFTATMGIDFLHYNVYMSSQ